MPDFAKRMEYMAGSAEIIRGLFGAMNDPETISFGGGAPATDALPVEEIREIADDVLRRETRGAEALQYGPVQGIRQLRNTSAFGAWIFRILRNCCSRNIKSIISLRENMQKLYDSGADASALAAGPADPSAAIELAEALSQLTEDEREVVLLSAVCGLTSREISGITGLTAGASRSKLSRSLAKMRDFLS